MRSPEAVFELLSSVMVSASCGSAIRHAPPPPTSTHCRADDGGGGLSVGGVRGLAGGGAMVAEVDGRGCWATTGGGCAPTSPQGAGTDVLATGPASPDHHPMPARSS